MAALVLQSRFPPDRIQFLRILAKSLRSGQFKVRADDDAVLLTYTCEGVTVGYRLPADFFQRWEAHHGAYKVEVLLRHRACRSYGPRAGRPTVRPLQGMARLDRYRPPRRR